VRFFIQIKPLHTGMMSLTLNELARGDTLVTLQQAASTLSIAQEPEA
jgi:hypothetical protein